jgi:CBS domain containing-hemolysin-like protein
VGVEPPSTERLAALPGALSILDDAVDPLSMLAGPLLLLALIAANAFFVVGEFSLITVDRARVERLAGSDRRARRVLASLERLTQQLSGAQLGITLASLLLGFLAEPALAEILRPPLGRVPLLADGLAVATSVLIAFVLSTVGQMVLGEQVPKTIAITDPLRSALLVAAPLRLFCRACWPAIVLLNGAANRVVRWLGVEPRDEIAAARSIEELQVVIQTSVRSGVLDQPTGRLLARAVRFRDKIAADALVPRVAMATLPRRASAAELVRASVESRHERFPVYGRDRDDIVGVAEVHDALRLPPEDRPAVPVERLMRRPLVLPATVHLDRLLAQLRESGERMAVIIDEYGGTAGIVTAEDVLEEMAGEIDAQPLRRPPLEARGWLLPGAAPLDQVLDETGLELPDGPYATLAGFLFDQLGELPEVGDAVELDGWTVRIAATDRHRITWVDVSGPPGNRG